MYRVAAPLWNDSGINNLGQHAAAINCSQCTYSYTRSPKIVCRKLLTPNSVHIESKWQFQAMSIVEIIRFIFVELNLQHVDFSPFWFIYLRHYRIFERFVYLPLSFSLSFVHNETKQPKRKSILNQRNETNPLYVHNFSCSRCEGCLTSTHFFAYSSHSSIFIWFSIDLSWSDFSPFPSQQRTQTNYSAKMFHTFSLKYDRQRAPNGKNRQKKIDE